jgi:hypothetical protein
VGRLGNTASEVVLTEDEREVLMRWARCPKSAQALALRCRIVLECAKGDTNQEVAARHGLRAVTVSRWVTVSHAIVSTASLTSFVPACRGQ